MVRNVPRCRFMESPSIRIGILARRVRSRHSFYLILRREPTNCRPNQARGFDSTAHEAGSGVRNLRQTCQNVRSLEPPAAGKRPILRDMERSPENVLDELLVLEAQGGDERAFAELVERWQPRVLRHAFELTGRHELAADAAQESWIAVAKGLRRLADPACFPRWLLRIVSHKSVDAVREVARRRKLTEQAAAESPRTSDAARPALGAADDEIDDVGALRQAIARLPGDERALVSMFYWDQRLIAEIAHILDIPLGTVKSRLHRVRLALKERLERSKR